MRREDLNGRLKNQIPWTDTKKSKKTITDVGCNCNYKAISGIKSRR